MHKHLEKQLAKATTDGVVDVAALLASVSEYYSALDRERSLRDRSLGLMSEELLALNQRIQRQGEERFRSVFDQTGDGLLVTDAQGHITRSNQAAATLLGITVQALAGQSVSRFLPGPIDDGEREAACADGHTRPVEVRRTPLQIGELSSVLYNLRDISERQRVERERAAFTERLARSNSELERFAYIASHDLQEPLRSVISFSGLLERRLAPMLDADSREYLRFITEGGLRMQDMIRGLLELSRLDGSPPQPQAVSLAALMDEVRLELSAAITTAGAGLRCIDLPTVRADAPQIKRVLLNLVGNALKFRGADAPRIEVSAEPGAGGWRIRVRDNGIGIAPEHREQVFMVFRRLHTADAIPGTGMGLAICQRIVAAHGGQIGVDGAAGGGSVFHFTLPV